MMTSPVPVFRGVQGSANAKPNQDDDTLAPTEVKVILNKMLKEKCWGLLQSIPQGAQKQLNQKAHAKPS